MPAKIVCMASAKGGSGKTVLTATFGAFLAEIGKSVLIIDTDAATNGLTLMHLKEVMLQGEYALAAQRRPRGIYEGLLETEDAEFVTIRSGVKLIPATYNFTNLEGVPVEVFSRSLCNTLAHHRKEFDYIFLDAQAGADSFAQVAMKRSMSDEVVIISEYDPISAAGVERLKALLREDLTYERTWVLLNKMLPDFVQSFSDFLEVAKYASPIPWDAEVVRAYSRRRLALDLERGNEYTIAIMQTMKSLFGEGIGAELTHWLNSRVAALREPIEVQHRDAERELEGLILQRHELLRSSRQRSLFLIYVLLFLSTGPAATFSVARFWRPDVIKGESWYALVAGLAAIGAVLVALFQVRKVLFELPVDFDIRQYRISRQEEVLKERLKKLEALRHAEPESLLRQRVGKETA